LSQNICVILSSNEISPGSQLQIHRDLSQNICVILSSNEISPGSQLQILCDQVMNEYDAIINK